MSKLTDTIPSENGVINLKGRKCTVIRVDQIDENNFHVHIVLEKVAKKQAILQPNKKRK